MNATTDDDWCDWCALEIRGAPLHVDGRVFCTPMCLGAYRNGSELSSVIDMPQRRDPGACSENADRLARLEAEGPSR
ncbi:hypothetical protein B7C42_05332 [Nocardia cerradoensis]|uniref:Uncharacterized protein n=1 Tax=Nocardia cerradoensis TaxID=85688 RepID=A0A231H115_9NOCA|nr:hypothetical protein [Nocardia cerradoensis]OXR42555.1 hypothetical protein B7C42_05332 [Nocardia cerradoensis]